MGHTRRLGFAPTISILALVVALSGTAYAAGNIRSRDIVNGSIKTRDLQKGAVTGAKVKDGSISRVDLANDAQPVAPLPPAYAAHQNGSWFFIGENANKWQVMTRLPLPAGSHVVHAKAWISTNGPNARTVECRLRAGASELDHNAVSLPGYSSGSISLQGEPVFGAVDVVYLECIAPEGIAVFQAKTSAVQVSSVVVAPN